MDMGTSPSQVLGGDLAFLLGGKNLPKKSVAFPAMSRLTLPEVSVSQGRCGGQSLAARQRGGCGVPNIHNQLRPFFFFFLH